MRTRKDVWKLAASDDTLLWYARAIAAMKKRPITDPTSWRYQAAIHDYDPSDDPLAVPKEKLPSQSDQDTFWARCQHGSWFFLPWHRGFLFYFEQILLREIKQLKGPSDWALPYWNYSDPSNPNARCLPPAFRNAKLPDGTPNALFVTQRTAGANAGSALGSPASAEISSCLKKSRFMNSSAGGGAGFGGGRTGFSHGGGVPGECENVPHGSMHVAVGGPTGWMSAFNTAGLDPIFWLHHSNIDRLWEVWRHRDPAHLNPSLGAWLSGIAFNFHDAKGKAVTLKVQDVLDTTKPLLDYVYEDISDPLATAHPAAVPSVTATRTPMDMEPIPEMLGATDTRAAITLGAKPSSIQFDLQPSTGPTARAATSEAPREVHLNLENITATSRPIESYMVYVNLPEGAKPEAHPELRAGLLPAFGILEASRRTKEHAGDGVGHSYDITGIVSVLESRKLWNPKSIRITFVPDRTEAELAKHTATKPIKVGRVSLYYA